MIKLRIEGLFVMRKMLLLTLLTLGVSRLAAVPNEITMGNVQPCDYFSHSTCCLVLTDTLDATKGYLSDIDTLKVWVETLHPLPFARLSKVEWDAACENAKMEVAETATKLSMTIAVGSLLGKLKDSHTMISLGAWMKKEMGEVAGNTLRLSSIDRDVYVKHDKRGLIAPGTKVTTINGLNMEDVFDNAKMISPQEGKAWLSRVRIAERMIIPMAIAMTENSQMLLSINGEEYHGVQKQEESSWRNHRRKRRDTGLNWEFKDELARLEINSFTSGSGWRYFRKLHHGFKLLKKHGDDWGIKGLVIDLRGNLGGIAYRMENVFYYLTQEEIQVPIAYIPRQSKESSEQHRNQYRGILKWIVNRWGDEENGLINLKRMAELEIGEVDTIRYDGIKFEMNHLFEGPVVVLIDGLSSSASVSFIAEFNRLDRGHVIGEPCNGPNSGTFADPVERQLPESGLGVVISTGRFVMDEEFAIRSRPIKPSRWVQWSELDLIENRDPFESAIHDWVSDNEVGDLKRLSERESKVLWEELDAGFSRNRLWGGAVRSEVWSKIVEGDACVRKAKIEGDNFKQCKTSRNVETTLALPQGLRVKFEQLIAPGRPAVLHFGIHNRMDCNVCKTN